MQTFLPYANFYKSAECLDMKRLGKQRVECWQIINAINKKSGWSNHPIVKMWRGHIYCLAQYGKIICEEWIKRGYNDSMLPRFKKVIFVYKNNNSVPYWLGNKKFHDSHKSNLLRKNKEWYSQFNWDVSNDLPYVWFKDG